MVTSVVSSIATVISDYSAIYEEVKSKEMRPYGAIINEVDGANLLTCVYRSYTCQCFRTVEPELQFFNYWTSDTTAYAIA